MISCLFHKKTDEPGRGTRAQIRGEACARYSPVAGTALELDEMPLSQDDPRGNKDPTSGEGRTVGCLSTGSGNPAVTFIWELRSVDALESFPFQGSGN